MFTLVCKERLAILPDIRNYYSTVNKKERVIPFRMITSKIVENLDKKKYYLSMQRMSSAFIRPIIVLPSKIKKASAKKKKIEK